VVYLELLIKVMMEVMLIAAMVAVVAVVAQEPLVLAQLYLLEYLVV
jgi:hypothetical protein